MRNLAAAAAIMMLVSSAAGAQLAPSIKGNAEIVVPSHTEVVFRLDEEIASNRVRLGQLVPVSVARDVLIDGMVMIPRGSAGFGAVTSRTGKGSFGKSGKLDIELRSVDVGGRTIPVVGRYHAAGRGRAGETIGTILVGGVIAGAFVTGRHAVFEEGREFTAYTGADARMPLVHVRQIAPITALSPQFARATSRLVPDPPRQFAENPHLFETEGEGPADAKFDSLVRLQRSIAEAQPVRGREPRQGWTISD